MSRATISKAGTALTILGLALLNPGCSPSEPEPAPMPPTKMESGKMESGKMDSKMEGAAPSAGKMEGTAPEVGKMDKDK